MDIKGIGPSFCTHKILMEEDFKPVVQHQIRLNPNTQDVVKKEEVLKLLDARLNYLIFDSPWVSHVQLVPKKGGMTVVTNDKKELIHLRTVTVHKWWWSRGGGGDGIWPEDVRQGLKSGGGERRLDDVRASVMWRNGNVGGRFVTERAKMENYKPEKGDSVEISMDDFSVFGYSLNLCLENLKRMLAQCEEANLVLNWKRYHFMVKEGIVLRYKISQAGL
ncbi:uncharacterized protein LOC143547802 [Bidens hawaiensis]|uniref:uncharacterized protein LOC143547802 n=1 Tax=Bidens hawaiensis TaxID=980011 RepID=UPI00404A316A